MKQQQSLAQPGVPSKSFEVPTVPRTRNYAKTILAIAQNEMGESEASRHRRKIELDFKMTSGELQSIVAATKIAGNDRAAFAALSRRREDLLKEQTEADEVKGTPALAQA